MGVPGGARSLRLKETLESPLRPEEEEFFRKIVGDPPAAGSGGSKRESPLAVVAEDDALIRQYVSLRLQTFGFSCLEAKDGEQALRLVAREKPDLLLLDIRMPVMDGYKVIRGIRSFLKLGLLPIIVMTGLDSVADETSALSLGADQFLVKSIEQRRFDAKLEAIARRVKLLADGRRGAA